MKSISLITICALIAAALFGLVLFTACSKENSCADTRCLNGGVCTDGACVCPPNYSGKYCQQYTDGCEKLQCQNNASCANGVCQCPSGIGGVTCDIIYRDTYMNTYKGNGTDNAVPANNHPNWRVIFSPSYFDTHDYAKMNMELYDNTALSPVRFDILLTSFSDEGSDFTIYPYSADGYTYTGSGRVSKTKAELSLTKSNISSGSTTVYTFTNMPKI